MNAFGSVKKGRAEIVDYLRDLFADANFNAGRLVAAPTSVARRLSATVAVVSSHVRIEGQGLVGGGEIALRNNRSLRVLQNQDDTRWLIASEMYMDARRDWSCVNHS